jgi:hypothetical protein
VTQRYNIGFVLMSEHSSYNAALGLARAVQERGHGRAFSRGEYVRLVAGKWLEHARNASFERALRRLGRRSAWSEWKRRPRLPEVVFGHRALDWPALASAPDRYYFGTTDLFRGAPPFDWSGIDLDRPVVYCNLSTINGFENIDAAPAGRAAARADLSVPRFRMARRYLDAVLGCFAQRTDWQLLLACGPFHAALKDEVRSPNIHLYERLPQLAVLPKADLAICWGGAGTVRECVNHRVPMVILPAWTDQFGNAARVVARNLGARADIFAVTAQHLAAIVERVLADRSIRTAMADVTAQCDPDAEIAGLVRFVERHAGLRL